MQLWFAVKGVARLAFETSCLSLLGHKAVFCEGKGMPGQDFLSLCGGVDC